MQKIPHSLLKKMFSYYVMLNVDFGIFTNSDIYSVHWKSVKIGQVGGMYYYRLRMLREQVISYFTGTR